MELQAIRYERAGLSSQRRIDHFVERLCQQGCRQVNEVIAQLRMGQVVSGTEAMDDHERSHLLHELVTIMAVYQGSCGSK